MSSKSANEAQHVVRAIPTSYKGFLFRSRLEARYALFFDELGLKWEYEPEGFELPGGVRYLPDFCVQTPQGARIWYEIKRPNTPTDPKFEHFIANIGEISQYEEGDRAQLLDGDPVDMLERADVCPRCGMFHVKRGTDGIKFDATVFANGQTYAEYFFNCMWCDWETPSGGGHPMEKGFLQSVCYPHKGSVMIMARTWDRIIEKKIMPAALKARAEQFNPGARK
jgi:hypothetical protein